MKDPDMRIVDGQWIPIECMGINRYGNENGAARPEIYRSWHCLFLQVFYGRSLHLLPLVKRITIDISYTVGRR